MADEIAVMNDGRIEQRGSADRALRAPAHRVRRQVPRHLEPDRRPRRPEALRVRDRTTARACTCRADRLRRRRRRPCASACGPRRSTLVAPEEAARRRRERAAGPGHRRELPRRRRSSTSSRPHGGEEITVVAQNRAAEPRALGPGRDVLAGLAPAAHLRRRQGETTHAERGLERARSTQLLAAASALAAPCCAVGAAGLTAGAAAFLAACGGVEGTAGRAPATGATVNHPKTPIGKLDFSNWPLYIDKKVNKDFDKQLRRQGQVHRGHQRQRGVLRQGPPAARRRGRPIGRDLVALTDWMAARWIALGYAEPIDKKNVPNEKNLQPASSARRSTRTAPSRCRGSPA